MTDPFVPAGGEPTERTFEWLHKWGQLVPLLGSDPRQATALLEDRDRAAAQWINAHAHDAGGVAAGGFPTEQTDWFAGVDVDVSPGNDQVLTFDNSTTLVAGDVLVVLDSPGVFHALEAAEFLEVRTRYLTTITAQLEDTDPSSHWDLWVETASEPTFTFDVVRRYLQRTTKDSNHPTGISAGFLLVNANPVYWRYGVTLVSGSALDQAVIADPNPVVSHSLVWWSLIDE